MASSHLLRIRMFYPIFVKTEWKLTEQHQEMLKTAEQRILEKHPAMAKKFEKDKELKQLTTRLLFCKTHSLFETYSGGVKKDKQDLEEILDAEKVQFSSGLITED